MERRVHEVPIELAAANAVRERKLDDLARDAGAESYRGSYQTLRQRQQIRLDGHL
jgi:hypothetical protein